MEIETFMNNFVKDSKVFGEELTQEIYEDIFSAIVGRKVHLDKIINELDSQEETSTQSGIEPEPEVMVTDDNGNPIPFIPGPETYVINQNGELNSTGKEIAKNVEKSIENAGSTASATATTAAASTAAATTAQGAEAAANLAKTPNGFFKSIKDKVNNSEYVKNLKQQTWFINLKNWFKGLGAKISAFFGKLSGKSFSEIFNHGVAWVKNPANLPTILGTTGGVVLLALIIKTLRRNKQLKNYPALQAYYDRRRQLKEDCYNPYEDETKQSRALRLVLEECKHNKLLAKAMSEDEGYYTIREEDSYFNY